MIHDCNIYLGQIFITPSFSITTLCDYGIKVDAYDGLWISNTYVGNSRVANYSFGSSVAGALVGNTYISNCMSDHSKLHGIRFTGTTPIYSFRWEGRTSGFSQGAADAIGILIESPCGDVTFNCTVDGYKGGGSVVNNASAQGITFLSPQIFSIDTDDAPGPYEPSRALHVNAGSNITVLGGLIDGGNKTDWGIEVGSSGSNVTISGTAIKNHTDGAIRIVADTGVIATGCDLRNNSGTTVSLPTTRSTIQIDNCLGFSPLKNQVTWNPGTINAGLSAMITLTVTGADWGDFVAASCGIPLYGLTLSAYVSAIDTVTLVLANPTANPISLGSQQFFVLAQKRI
jgi:hypothetical protein